MQDDLLSRLREVGCDREPFTDEHKHCICRLTKEAADTIERMKDELLSWRQTRTELRAARYAND